MLILTSDRVLYCKVQRSVADQLEIVPGLIYQAQLFSQCASYSPAGKQDAIRWCRQKLIEYHEEILFLIIEDAEGFTVWRQDDNLQYAGSYHKTDWVASIDLKKLVVKMRQAGGVTIKDRRYNLKVYANCFVGREAVSWMMKTLDIDQEHAIDLGQRLIDEHWIHHITHNQPFRDEYLFYRFFEDD